MTENSPGRAFIDAIEATRPRAEAPKPTHPNQAYIDQIRGMQQEPVRANFTPKVDPVPEKLDEIIRLLKKIAGES